MPNYQYNILPMGLSVSAGSMMHHMYKIFEDEMFRSVTCYLDDITTFSESFREHLQHLRNVLKKLDQYDFRLKTTKCNFFTEEVEILGFNINKGRIHTSTKNTEAITKMKSPTTLTGVRKALASFNWFRHFIPDFAKKTKKWYN